MTTLDPEGIIDPTLNEQLGDDGIIGCNWQVQAAVDVTRTSTSCPITVTPTFWSCASITYPAFDYLFEVIVNDAFACPLLSLSASVGTPVSVETTTATDTLLGRKRYRVSVSSTAPDCTGVTLVATNNCGDSASAHNFNCAICRNYLRLSIPAYTWSAAIVVPEVTPAPFPSGTRRFYTSTNISETIEFPGGTVFFRTFCNPLGDGRKSLGSGTYTQSISGIVKLFEPGFPITDPPSLVSSGTYGAELSATINFWTDGSNVYFEFADNKVTYDSWWDDFGSDGGFGFASFSFSGSKCATAGYPAAPTTPSSSGCTRFPVTLAQWTNSFPFDPLDVCGGNEGDFPLDLRSYYSSVATTPRCIFKFGPKHNGAWDCIGNIAVVSCDGGTRNNATGFPVGTPCPCGTITATRQYVTL